MNPPNQRASLGSAVFTVVGVLLAFTLLAWMVIDSSGYLHNKEPFNANADIVNVTAENWQEQIVESKIPVVVDFWAPWCPPCIKLAPTIDKVAATYSGRVKVCKVNFDDASELVAKYRIRGIPVVFIFNKGEIANVVRAPITERSLVEAIDALLQE